MNTDDAMHRLRPLRRALKVTFEHGPDTMTYLCAAAGVFGVDLEPKNRNVPCLCIIGCFEGGGGGLKGLVIPVQYVIGIDFFGGRAPMPPDGAHLNVGVLMPDYAAPTNPVGRAMIAKHIIEAQ